MCRLKYYTISQNFGWHLSGATAFAFLVLGAISFGYGLKLMEYAEKKDITPIFAGVPMLFAGVFGAAVTLSRKKWAVTCHAIMCVIVSMLSIHMNYRFMVKEFSIIPLYRRQCQSEPGTDNHHCNQYSGTIMLCCVSVSMIPVTLAALLSCLIAYKTLKKTNCYVIWFTFAKVVPTRHINSRKTRDLTDRQNNKTVELLNYKQSTEYEIPETLLQSEYLPRIPDFMALAGNHSSNPAYRASVILQNEPALNKNKERNQYSKSMGDLEQNHAQRRLCDERDSGLLVKKDDPGLDQRNGSMPRRLASTSDVDLRLIDQDVLNRWGSRENSCEYYDDAAEDWIKKIMDNLENSRGRLYGISDEEDLEGDNELTTCSIDVNDPEYSNTMQPFLSKGNNENKERVHKDSENKAFSTTTRSLLEGMDRIPVEKCTENNDFSTTARSPPQQSLSEVNTTSFSDKNENLAFSIKTNGTTSSPVQDDDDELDQVKINNKETAGSTTNIQVIENQFIKDLTPPGLITPKAGHSSPNGQLHFEFVSSAATEHARKNWIEFEEEEVT